MSSRYSKFWTRETDADLALPDGHKMRIALETRRPQWVGFRSRHPDNIIPANGWDGVPESRLILMHDDWPESDKRLRTARTWVDRTDYDSNHAYGLAWLIDQLGERQDELPALLCEEFTLAFSNMIEGIFSDCAFFLPQEDSRAFEEYSGIYLEPALAWLLECTPETCEGIPMIHD
jgi:hypothetical protein